MSETGTATLGMKVARGFLRKTNTTRTTSSTEITNVFFYVVTGSAMVTV